MLKGSRVSVQEGPAGGGAGSYLVPLAFLKQLEKIHVDIPGGYKGWVTCLLGTRCKAFHFTATKPVIAERSSVASRSKQAQPHACLLLCYQGTRNGSHPSIRAVELYLEK